MFKMIKKSSKLFPIERPKIRISFPPWFEKEVNLTLQKGKSIFLLNSLKPVHGVYFTTQKIIGKGLKNQ